MHKFVKSIISFSLQNRFFIFFMTGVLIVAGLLSFKNTPIEAFPDVTNPKVVIISQWPGRSAEEIEKFISIPIEIELNSVPGKTNIRSISLFGLSVVTVSFGDGVDEFKARQLVANRLMNVDMPEDIVAEMQPSYGPTGEIFRYTLQSDTKTVRELKTLQDWVIERRLRAVPGIADVVSFGGEVKTYEVSADPVKMAQYGITALELYEALANSNINVGGDIIERNNQAYVVRGMGLLNDIEEIENVIVDKIDDTPILVKNVAKVFENHMPMLGIVGVNGEDKVDKSNLVQGIVVMRKGENPGIVIDRLKDKIEQLERDVLPDDVKMVTFYDRSNLIEYTTSTVLKNLFEGIFFVIIFVMLFMADWRTTFMVSIIIPLSLLFALVCMRIQGMSANLLSLGAIDFGIIVDGAVVMVEGLFVVLDRKAKKLGMDKYNKLSKLGIIKKSGSMLGKNLLSSQLITILALVPIFAFREVEGKMFSPLAYTFGFALLGALIMSLTLVPAMVSFFLNKDVKEKDNFFVRNVHKWTYNVFVGAFRKKKLTFTIALAILVGGMGAATKLGTEFLPQLNEGAIYIRAMMPISTNLTKSHEYTEEIRQVIRSFPEVKSVLSQTGRPNDGTDPTGFFNIEMHAELFKPEDWERDISKAELIEEMQQKLEKFQGVNFNFSQPIMDNVEESVSGVKGAIALKIFGRDIFELEALANEARVALSDVEGIEDLRVVPLGGQPELQIDLSQDKMALYGVQTSDAQSVIEMAIGGKAATQLYEGEKKFDIRVRYQEDYRKSAKEIGDILVPTLRGSKIRLKEIAEIKNVTGPAFVFRSDNERFAALTFSVRGRDLGSTIAEAQEVFGEKVQLKQGMHASWNGEFESQVRAQKTLKQVVPVVFVLIFIVLLTTFGNAKDAGLVMLNVPFALVGGIFGLHLFGVNFSISAGVGFIALFGICVQNGVILLSKFKSNLQERMSLDEAIRNGIDSRIRPVLMTATTSFIGLIPASLSTGIGSESQKPLAIVIVVGIMTATILTLFVFPLIFEFFYKNKYKSQENKQKPDLEKQLA
ncbi:efflux RND transporter permease subunit [Aureibacter tunicatorum]|uniref:Cobalt-zinc-cadmium resistance protein CzcA n=1 Tax=Aureibacter tunicatorum TaxID=866807 RepID=A0AAE4BP40_9BACT|nr:CusA/CzcA family heavy metal efflux RND transporter [Aureibacter tunicatorum]MDR6237534.1 cobalt-zinc-cadmium resistance protein CzcA [Aureibacter tunicatorum]BDD02568.1 cation transporter [Aureibacter tunicatorum]